MAERKRRAKIPTQSMDQWYNRHTYAVCDCGCGRIDKIEELVLIDDEGVSKLRVVYNADRTSFRIV